jgi:hypothetical protein
MYRDIKYPAFFSLLIYRDIFHIGLAVGAWVDSDLNLRAESVVLRVRRGRD